MFLDPILAGDQKASISQQEEPRNQRVLQRSSHCRQEPAAKGPEPTVRSAAAPRRTPVQPAGNLRRPLILSQRFHGNSIPTYTSSTKRAQSKPHPWIQLQKEAQEVGCQLWGSESVRVSPSVCVCVCVWSRCFVARLQLSSSESDRAERSFSQSCKRLPLFCFYWQTKMKSNLHWIHDIKKTGNIEAHQSPLSAVLGVLCNLKSNTFL